LEGKVQLKNFGKNKLILLSQTINGGPFVPISETNFAKAAKFLSAFLVSVLKWRLGKAEKKENFHLSSVDMRLARPDSDP
jgi:hypothetical protein